MVRSASHSEVEMPEDIQGLMSEFSHSNPEVCRWLKVLHEQANEQFYLIIADYTDAEIPWEMLELSFNEYLGAVVTTVRWQHILQDHQNCFMEVKSEECCGKVLAYVNREELGSATLECSVLETLQSLIHQDIREFQNHLKQELANFGLVYLACHGVFGQDIRSFAFGSKSDRTQQIKFMELRRHTLMLLQASPSIVFINACHSGRLQMDKKYVRDRYRRGFAELFLGKGARGVIGTLGEVNDEFAAQFARNLLEETLQSPHLPVATILKKIRAKVVSHLPDQPTTEDLLPFIYTFMYVYYGNPMTVLRLNQRGADFNG
jgi:CHAT domain